MQNYNNDHDVVKMINKLRLDNKNKWYYVSFTYHHINVKIKGFGTWLQIFSVNGTDHGNVMESKVSEYKANIYNALQYGYKHSRGL